MFAVRWTCLNLRVEYRILDGGHLSTKTRSGTRGESGDLLWLRIRRIRRPRGALGGLIHHCGFRVVATARSNRKFAVMRRVDFDVNYSISTQSGWLCRVISDGVLIADIFGHFGRDLINVFE